MSGKKIYLEDSLDHLKKYIEIELGLTFEVIEILTGEENRPYLLENFKKVTEDINHAIDHIKVDHLDER